MHKASSAHSVTGKKFPAFVLALSLLATACFQIPAHAKGLNHSTSVAAVTPLISPPQVDPEHITLDCNSPDKEVRAKMAKGVSEVTIKAPKELVWRLLTDFNNYPHLFPRMKTCTVTKREGNLVYCESNLKPQIMVKQTVQHTINDLGGRPDVLRWKAVDGNFKAVEGEWSLKSTKDGRCCQVRYTLALDAGPAIPKPMVGFVIKMMQKEIVGSIKEVAETEAEEISCQSQTAFKANKD